MLSLFLLAFIHAFRSPQVLIPSAFQSFVHRFTHVLTLSLTRPLPTHPPSHFVSVYVSQHHQAADKTSFD